MAQIKCPNGHFYNDELYNQCPYCQSSSPLPPPPPPPIPPSPDNKIPWVVTGVAALIAAFCFVQSNDAQRELDQINSSLIETHKNLNETEGKLSELAQELDSANSSADVHKKFIGMMRNTYGHGSDSFHASSPMLILKAGGETQKLTKTAMRRLKC